MNKRNLIFAGIAVGITAIIFIVLFRNGVNQPEGEVVITSEENHGHNHGENAHAVSSAVSYLDDNIGHLHFLDDRKAGLDSAVIFEYADGKSTNSQVDAYFQALKAIMLGDTQGMQASYTNMLTDDLDDESNEHLVILLEDINLRGLDAGMNEIWCRMNLAGIYKYREQVMLTVQQLLAVVESDSNHLRAIYELAVMSVQSGQLEKARERFKKLVSLQPQNRDFRQQLIAICKELNDSECIDSYSE